MFYQFPINQITYFCDFSQFAKMFEEIQDFPYFICDWGSILPTQHQQTHVLCSEGLSLAFRHYTVGLWKDRAHI